MHKCETHEAVVAPDAMTILQASFSLLHRNVQIVVRRVVGSLDLGKVRKDILMHVLRVRLRGLNLIVGRGV